jgi:hypothetical protein
MATAYRVGGLYLNAERYKVLYEGEGPETEVFPLGGIRVQQRHIHQTCTSNVGDSPVKI